MFEGVVCPDFIRDQWRERLIIDLDPTYPLDLSFTEDDVCADLSFGGFVSRCRFPYGAVYVVADRSTGRGIVLDQNMPESVRRSRYGKPGVQAPAAARANLRSVVQTDPASEEPEEVPPQITEQVAEQAEKRRAAFKVIDGGG